MPTSKAIITPGTSLAVQWLRRHASTAGAWVWSLVGELRSHMLHNVARSLKNNNSKIKPSPPCRYNCGARQLEPRILTSFPPCPTTQSPDRWTAQKSKCCLWAALLCERLAVCSLCSPGSALKKQVANSYDSPSRRIWREHILMWFWKADTNMLVMSINSASSEKSPASLLHPREGLKDLGR